MKTLNKMKSFIILLTSFFMGSVALAGETQEAVAPAVEHARPLYEKFGMTSTQLFIVMLLVTIVLVIVVAALSFNAKHVIEFKMNKKGQNTVKALLLLAGLFSSTGAMAAEDAASAVTFSVPFPDESFYIFLGFDIILLLIILYLTGLMNGMLYEFVQQRKRVFWRRMSKSLTDATPIEDEGSILLDHDYDGIKELDNNLPPWWKYGFYITIVWAFGYVIYYHMLGGTLQTEEYEIAMAEADADIEAYKKAHPELITVDNVELLTDKSALAQGRTIFEEKCQVCHMEGGRGGVGPNLTDENWIYEGDIKGIFESIYGGRSNGMQPWNGILNGAEIQAVASYIYHLEPILPPEGQDPKGDNIYKR
ncbi:MAG: cbb3-type cytochrome c oxidase N-terminal domain-containing protein [Crocinitomicaceae bacterium]